ncbi:MAG: hypothetical protein ACUVXG_05370 [Anaerolineae bacterium]
MEEDQTVPVLTDEIGVARGMPLRVEMEDLLRVSKNAASQPAIRAAAEWAAARAVELAEPAGVYRWVAATGVKGERLHLETGDSLAIGEKAHLLEPAEEVLIFVNTIGPRLEQEVRECFSQGKGLEGYLLDCAGVLALASVREHLRHLAEEEAHRRGWGVSFITAPGSLVGWPVKGQRELCALLDLGAIGVTLNSSNILFPAKSASGLIGIGRGYSARRAEPPCRFCQLAATCWRRRP